MISVLSKMLCYLVLRGRHIEGEGLMKEYLLQIFFMQ